MDGENFTLKSQSAFETSFDVDGTVCHSLAMADVRTRITTVQRTCYVRMYYHIGTTVQVVVVVLLGEVVAKPKTAFFDFRPPTSSTHLLKELS